MKDHHKDRSNTLTTPSAGGTEALDFQHRLTLIPADPLETLGRLFLDPRTGGERGKKCKQGRAALWQEEPRRRENRSNSFYREED